ncbi:hypothetical protein LT493_29675 [Streptomyces tricolor]|nr:hypothetical protein [Streptomyces tricolor]
MRRFWTVARLALRATESVPPPAAAEETGEHHSPRSSTGTWTAATARGGSASP